MAKRFWALTVLTVFLLAAGTVRAQSVDDKIKSLEQELTQLKDQQVEMKKEATAAVAALPTFSYRPGNGLNIEAADKSWGFRATIETHFRMYFNQGQDQYERTNGEIEARRFRPGFFIASTIVCGKLKWPSIKTALAATVCFSGPRCISMRRT